MRIRCPQLLSHLRLPAPSHAAAAPLATAQFDVGLQRYFSLLPLYAVLRLLLSTTYWSHLSAHGSGTLRPSPPSLLRLLAACPNAPCSLLSPRAST